MINKNGKVLLADDDEDFLRTYHTILEKAGFQVLDATNGEETLGIAMRERPDVLVLDVSIPKKDGLAVMKEMRTMGEDWAKNVPIIILTGKNLDDERIRAVADWNPTYYLVKGNTSSSELIRKIESVV